MRARRTLAGVALLCATTLSAEAPAPAPARDVCARAPSREPTFPALLPIEIFNDHVYVRVCANGRPLDFLLDTGAPSSYFDLGVAQRLGVRAGQTFRVSGAGAGTVTGARLERAQVEVYGAIAHPVEQAIDLSGIVPREGHRIDGILGGDFIRRFVVRIDYSRGEMGLFDRDRHRYEGGGSPVRLDLDGNYPHVTGEVRLADGAVIRGRMLLDVGSSQTLSLHRSIVVRERLRTRVGTTVRRRSGSGVGGAITADIGRVASLRLGSAEIPRPIVVLHGDSAGVFSQDGAWIATVGGGVLRRFAVILDYGRKRMYLEDAGASAEPFEADMSGVTLVSDTALASIVIDAVIEGSAGAAVGLARGDTVVTVNGRPASGELMDVVRDWFRSPGTVELTLRRGGETRVVTLVLRREL